MCYGCDGVSRYVAFSFLCVPSYSPIIGRVFIGSWVVQTALEKGLTVHGTCRNKDKAYFLTKLDGASERLKLFSGCDLSEPDSFREAIKGCETVIHTASPFFRVDDEVEGIKKLVEPAVEGTRNVLNCCSELGVKKVVLTSSTAAVYVVYGSKGSDHVFSEADWSDEELLKAKKNFYSLSKTRAEKLAWEISNQDNCSFKLSVMNPCLVRSLILRVFGFLISKFF